MRLSQSVLRFLAIVLFAGTVSSSLRAGDIKPQELIAKHLDAIGSPEARNQLKSRVVQGASTYRVLVGGTGAIDGKFAFASEGAKANFLFKINAGSYTGEQFICDGDKTSVVRTYSDKTRSEFGYFMYNEDEIIRENVFGGVWSTNWPLLDIEGHRAKIHVEGMKKVDGKELLAVRYQPKKSYDIEIMLYFDPQTYRHLMTVYSREMQISVVGGELAQAEKSKTRSRLEERFSDFKTADGFTLPYHYDVRYTLEMESGFTKTVEWEVTALDIANNVPIDPRSFQLK